MPQIPLPPPPPSALAGAPQSRATGEEFGSTIPSSQSPAVGIALEGLGANIENLGQSFGELNAKKQAGIDAEKVATATAKNSFTPTYNDIVTNAAPDGSGLVQTVDTKGMQWIDKQVSAFAAGGASPAAIRQYRLNLLNLQQQHMQNAANQATAMSDKNAQLDAQQGLAQQLNDISAGGAIDQANFQVKIDTAFKLIDGQPLKDDVKKELKNNFLREATGKRFDAALQAAEQSGDSAAITKIINEAHDPYWRDKFDPNTLDKRLAILSQTQGEVDKLKLNNDADVHLNNIRAHPENYQPEMKLATEAFAKNTTLTGLDKTQALTAIRSNGAAMYFEGKGEKATTPEEIDALTKELKDNFADELTPKAFDAELKSLADKKNILQQNMNATTKAAYDLQGKVNTQKVEEVTTLVKQLNEQATKMAIPDEVMSDLNKKASDLETALAAHGDTMNPALVGDIKDLFTKREAFRRTTKQSNATIQKYIYEQQTGARDLFENRPGDASATPVGQRTIPGDAGAIQAALNRPGGSMLGHGAHLGYTADNGVKVVAAIQDHTHLMGMQPRAYMILSGAVAAAAPIGITRIEITAAAGGGHLSHSAGTEFDIVGYHADGTKWTAAERAQVARGAAGAGANRFGLYENANDLHIGYAHGNFPAAVWGAKGLTSGEASRQFTDKETQRFADQFAGGSVATNRDRAIVPYNNETLGAGNSISEQMPRYRNVIGQMETGGQANPYTFVANPTAGSKAALGRYGILLENIGPWSKQILGHEVSASEFLGNPNIQDQIFEGMFGMYVRKYGPEGAARAWLGGEGSVHNPEAKDANGTTVGGYGAKFTELMGGHSTYDSAPASPIAVADNREQFVAITAAQAVQAQNQQEMNNGGFMDFVASARAVPNAILSDEAGFAQRANDYEWGKQHFAPTAGQSTPFRPEEAANNQAILKSGDAPAILALAKAMRLWPHDMQEDAFRQLGQNAPTEVMAARYAAAGKTEMALSQIRGDAELKSDGAPPQWIKDAENAWTTPGGMGDILRTNSDIQANNLGIGLKGSIFALYRDKFGAGAQYDQAQMDKLVEDATGRAIGVVNGARTLMPPGTTSSEFGHFMEVADWTKVSLTQTPPAGFTNGNGPLVNMSPYDMSRMKPVAVGGNAYQFVNDDGQWAMTVGLDNQPIRYTAGIDKATIDDAIKSPEPQPGPTPVQGPLGVTPGADQPSIMGVPQPGGASRVTPPEGGLPVVPGSLAANPAAAAAFAAPAIAARGGSAGSPAPAPLPVATPVVPPTPNAPVVTPAPATPPQVPPVQQPSEGKLTEAEQAHVDDMMKLIMESSKRSNPNMTDAQRADYEKSLRDMMTRRELAGRGGEKPLKDLTGRTPLHRGGR